MQISCILLCYPYLLPVLRYMLKLATVDFFFVSMNMGATAGVRLPESLFILKNEEIISI